jgi:hypothetical protein
MCYRAKMFFHIEVLRSYLLFCHPTHQTEFATANRWGVVLLYYYWKQTTWTNHYDRPIRNTEQQWVRSYLLHSSFLLSCRCTTAFAVCLFLPATVNCTYYAMIKPISWAKPAHFDFSSSNFTVQYHRLSTAAGHAL